MIGGGHRWKEVRSPEGAVYFWDNNSNTTEPFGAHVERFEARERFELSRDADRVRTNADIKQSRRRAFHTIDRRPDRVDCILMTRRKPRWLRSVEK
jgi:hypothetical protein